jgi:hypothetical protein
LSVCLCAFRRFTYDAPASLEPSIEGKLAMATLHLARRGCVATARAGNTDRIDHACARDRITRASYKRQPATWLRSMPARVVIDCLADCRG